MMNRSKIDWCDFSWNPITGCLHSCSYCYARKQAKRFCGDIRLNKASPQLCREGNLYVLDNPFLNINRKVVPLPVGFEPTLHRYRLSMLREKKLPANIFVGSMADVFGAWVPDEWIQAVFEACIAAPWHRYMFLTKNPGRYLTLADKGLLPEGDNYWWGTTVTNQNDYDDRGVTIFHLPLERNTFFSVEPLHSAVEMGLMPDWIIIGAETGRRVNKPQREWIEDIVNRRAVERIFMKGNLKDIWSEPLIQEYPKGLEVRPLPLPKHRVYVESVRDKKSCKHCGTDLQGKPATRMAARYYLCPECLRELE